MNYLKKSSFLALAGILCVALFSFKSTTVNEKQLSNLNNFNEIKFVQLGDLDGQQNVAFIGKIVKRVRKVTRRVGKATRRVGKVTRRVGKVTKVVTAITRFVGKTSSVNSPLSVSESLTQQAKLADL